MFKSLLFIALCAFGVQSQASTVDIQSTLQPLVQAIHPAALINWTVGDSADYKMDGGIMSGTMHMFVREVNDQGFWLQQDVKLGFLGDHKMETLIDKNTGKPIKMLMDGQEQQIPDMGEQEITDSRREDITVPAGTFQSMWVKIHNKKDNTDSEAWLNPTIVPISGMIKSIQPNRMGKMTLEMTAFKKQ